MAKRSQLGAGIAPLDIIVTQANSGNDLVLSIAGTTDKITLSRTAESDAFRIEQVRFADGTTWSHADLMALAMTGTNGPSTTGEATADEGIPEWSPEAMLTMVSGPAFEGVSDLVFQNPVDQAGLRPYPQLEARGAWVDFLVLQSPPVL